MKKHRLFAAVVAALTTTAFGQCKISNYGKSCGPVFNGVVTPTGNTNRVSLTVSEAAPNSRVLIMVGAVPLNLDLRPFFGGTLDCRLFVRLDFLQQHRTNPAGRYVWGHAVPSAYAGSVYAQVAELRTNGSVLTSNGIKLTCE